MSQHDQKSGQHKSDQKQGQQKSDQHASSGAGKSQGSGSQSHDTGHSATQSQGHDSPIGIQKALKGVDYPASKKDLIQAAQKNHAPDDVMQKIRELPGDQFNKPTDVTRAFGQTD